MIEIKCKRQAYRIEEKNIIYIESVGHYVYFYVKTPRMSPEVKVYKVRQKLTDVKDQLGDNYIRVHRSYVVNISYILEINNQTIKVKLNNNNSIGIPVSRSRYPDICKALILP